MSPKSRTAGPTNESGTSSSNASPRRPWHPPVLERLGAWRALTLQQSIPIGPGFGLHSLPDIESDDRFA